jgi:predicted DCC family thiol-disulfide oxidoreductase YuxK
LNAVSNAMTNQAPILFYDGDCGLCAKVVQWLLRRDRHRRFRYAPLQGTTYAALGVAKPQDLSTMVLLDDRRLHERGDAALAVGRHLGGVWAFAAGVARIVPRAIRDAVYRFVARRRHRWFGHADACRLATPAERELFLN